MSVIIFIIGSVIGSTIGAFIERRDNLKEFLLGRSRCNSCKTTIPLYLNIPILSFLFLRGKCANCKSKIPFNVVAYEIITAVLFLLVYSNYGLTLKFLLRATEIILLLIISFSDLKDKEVYTLDIFFLLIIEIIYIFIFKLGFLKPFINIIILFIVYFIIYKTTNAMGEADVLLGAISGFFCNNYTCAFFILEIHLFLRQS